MSIVTAMLAILHPQTALANTCTPQTTSEFAVTGVALDDTLNVRAGPTTEYPVIAELGPNADGIGYGGDRYFIDWECQALCREATANGNTSTNQISEQCFQRNKVWFEIITPDSTNGWVSANFLTEMISEGDLSPSTFDENGVDLGATTGLGSADTQRLSSVLVNGSLLNVCAKHNYISEDQVSLLEARYQDYVSELGFRRVDIGDFVQWANESDIVLRYERDFDRRNGVFDPVLQLDCDDIAAEYSSLLN